MKKKIFIIIIVVLVVVALIAAAIYFTRSTRMVGHTTTVTTEDGGKQYMVAVGATSKLYEAWDSDSSEGTFLDIFNDVAGTHEDLATLIDEGGFPYKVPYEAETKTEPIRYLIQTKSGSTYWVEP